MARSFIENLNAVANASVLAGGDIVDDARQYRDEAEAAAEASEQSAIDSATSELLSADWAKKAYNNEVRLSPSTGLPEYSSYHWSVVSQNNATPQLINDNTTGTTTTWSSTKMSGIAVTKSDVGHNHDGDYEPPIEQNSAFNKKFAGTGTAITVSRSDHDHSGVYEPLINSGLAKLTAFNKNFGTTADTVMEGNFRDADKMGVADYVTDSLIKPTRLPFVADVNNPLATEIQPGNHRHDALGIDFDNTTTNYLTSSTVQGTLEQADSIFASLTISERCNITGGSSAGTTLVVTTPGTYVPLIIAYNSATSARNCQYNDGAQVYYNGETGTNPGDEGVKLIEGFWHATVTFDRVANSQYSITPLIKTLEGGTWTVPNGDFSVEAGDTSGDTVGTTSLTIGGWISHMAEGTIVGIGMTSTVAETIVIGGMTMSFSGAQDGALVASGSTVNHADLIGLGGTGVHTISDISGDTVTLANQLLAKADKAPPVTAGNLAELDASGNLVDSGIASTGVGTDKMDLVATPTLNNVVLMDGSGNSLDSGVLISDLAPAAGDNTQTFKVAAAVATDDAVQLSQLTSLGTNYVLLSTYNTHIGTTNPHNVTYGDVGAAALVHTHATSDVTGLDTALTNKYEVIAGAAEDNVPTFGTTGNLLDSGVAYTDILLTEDIGVDVQEYSVTNPIYRGTVTDLNNAVLDGKYDFAATATNAPIAKAGIVEVTTNPAGDIFQQVTLFNSGNTPIYKREYSDSLGAWLSWYGVITAHDYATSTVGGTIKILQTGTDCWITTDGSTPGP